MELKEIDKKLLAHLYSNSREPATKIAKTLNLSREQIAYRMNKFEKEGMIKGYIPIPSYNRLGYQDITIIFFRFRQKSFIRDFKQILKNNKNRIITVETLAKYDLGSIFIFKDKKERNESINEIIQYSHNLISEYIILEPYFSEFYPLKFLGDKTSSTKIFHEYKKEEYLLDEKEKKILKELNKNANLSIIEISKLTNISPELLIYKLKKLKQEKVLLGTRAYFDMKKIDYFYNILLINFHNFSKRNQDKLRQFAEENGSIDSLMLLLGNPNCYIQLFHKDIRELYNVINKLRDTFKDESFNIDILPLKNEGEDIDTLPFI